ncbi:MAG: T9SS type A sorting domain-containing protein [Bacteroidota bacterium]|nr:T9SS type A sorting domain-containing protein [Bacteroidota bacterium]
MSPITYVLTVNAVEDLAGNAVNNQQISFTSIYSINEAKNTNWQIYPNPVEDNLKINFDDQSEKNNAISIFDFTGRQIMQINKNIVGLISIDVSDLNNGIYFIQIESGKITSTSKFVKIK